MRSRRRLSVLRRRRGRAESASAGGTGDALAHIGLVTAAAATDAVRRASAPGEVLVVGVMWAARSEVLHQLLGREVPLAPVDRGRPRGAGAHNFQARAQICRPARSALLGGLPSHPRNNRIGAIDRGESRSLVLPSLRLLGLLPGEAARPGLTRSLLDSMRARAASYHLSSDIFTSARSAINHSSALRRGNLQWKSSCCHEKRKPILALSLTAAGPVSRKPPFYNCDVAILAACECDVVQPSRSRTASSSPKACIRITEPTKKQTDLWSQARANTPFIVAQTFVNLTRARPSWSSPASMVYAVRVLL